MAKLQLQLADVSSFFFVALPYRSGITSELRSMLNQLGSNMLRSSNGISYSKGTRTGDLYHCAGQYARVSARQNPPNRSRH